MKRNTSMWYKNVLLAGLLFMVASCKQKQKTNETDKLGKSKTMVENKTDAVHDYGSDVAFLKKHMNIIELSDEDGQGKVAVAPSLQGRVMTSSAKSDKGQSFGWINYDLIASGETQEHFNPVGGEERFWLGPEGGQYSIYFKPGTSFEFDNWYVPKELDTEPFDVVEKGNDYVSFEKQMQLLNYSGTTFDFVVERTVRMLSKANVEETYGISLEGDGIAMVGFETENKLTNIGENTWDQQSGMLSIWILSMLNPSDETNVILPFKKGEVAELGKIVTDYRFSGSAISKDRLSVLEDKGVVLFKADGKSREKIGVSPSRALPMAASYDAKNDILTLAYFTLPKEHSGYVNSLWELQENPFEGDAVNSYNDGPLDDGGQLGPFYEIESSSPAANLAKNEHILHIHGTVHLQGDRDKLEKITKQLFNLSLDEIKI